MREVLVTATLAVLVAGPVAGLVVPLFPGSWRKPPVVWGILLAVAAVVTWLRQGRTSPPASRT